MTGLDEIVDLQGFEKTLQEQAAELMKLLDKGDFAGAMQLLAALSEARNNMLYQEVGRLTRGLHEAIKQFNIDVEKSAALQVAQEAHDGDTHSEVSNAHERLNHVLELTESAANKTMDMVDASMPIAEELGEQAKLLRKDWQNMADQQSSMSELKDLGRTTETFLQEIEKGAAQLQSNYTEILLAQGFQDITGQLIKRVNGLVNDVEKSLIQLVMVAGKVDIITGVNREQDTDETKLATETVAAKEKEANVKGHGPLVLDEEAVDVVSGQDDVDDLLSSLGF
ncbi:protein phosphatase CheZ [Motiliproteus coralliicola]|uniref:Protein phosphatase CheZ n=1 Tax=Motiliproteus coralliicola TaxID=2283196 RepID=A0A369WK58_9GAMM|nr:protein phosphatase CheZ [Motiliproteus coralliicola]RDE22430.1 protein phosphatase CheZ [Motiliproteus coralliicola]